MRAKGVIVGGTGIANLSEPTTIKELIHEEFGDGIMSAVNSFSMDILRQPDRNGDRINAMLLGKVIAVQAVWRFGEIVGLGGDLWAGT